MRVALYNQMFALNGKSLVSNLAGHWAVHYQGKVSRILKRTDINRTINIVKKSKADIIGISEILEGQERELKNKLTKLGYKYLFFGKGHRTKFNNLTIKVAVASKIKCEKREIKEFPTKDELGGGGGMVYCYFPKLGLNMINIHFAILQKKKLYSEQLSFLKKHIEKLKGKIILTSDFNKSYNQIKRYFPGLVLASNQIKTCSLTPIFRTFHYRDDDHILLRGLKVKKIGELIGYSDHKLIYADLI